MARLGWLENSTAAEELGPAAAAWLDSGSLEAAARQAVVHAQPLESKYDQRSLAPELIANLAQRTNSYDVADTMRSMKNAIADNHVLDDAALARQTMAMRIAAQLGAHYPEEFRSQFLEPLVSTIGDTSRNYGWRLKTARDLAALARSGEIKEAINFPDLRMPQAVELAPEQQRAVRAQVESQLYDPEGLRQSIRQGVLHQLFPTVFGSYDSDGGIVGRPQHGGHEFLLDEHTLRVVDAVRQNPLFDSLSEKDQVNVMWAALLDDVGKQAGRFDPEHEHASANISWGLLRSLGYPVQRIQRIADLITRHSEMSYLPDREPDRFSNPDLAVDMAAFYRHPSALMQLLVLNESDIRSLNAAGDYWKPEVAASLQRDTAYVASEVRKLNQHAIPVLTSELPPDSSWCLCPMIMRCLLTLRHISKAHSCSNSRRWNRPSTRRPLHC